jgi:Tol biopolymer transport system component
MKRILMLITVVIASLLVADVIAQSGSELFSQALAKERTEGKLDEAIALYQRVATEFASDRTLAAKALVQMGRAYEKLGKGEARKAYDRVVRDYADQRELAAEASARIAALDRTLLSAAKGAASGLVAKQVWTGPEVDTLGSTSADGKYLSFTDWQTGDLAVREMATGDKRYLTRKGTWNESAEFAEMSTISPDASQIAYAWFNTDLFYELRVIHRDGGQSRVLYRNDQTQWLRPCAWSPDGKTLAVELSRRDRITQLALVSVVDGSVRVLKSLDWRGPTTMEFSPDGRYLAYDFPPIETAPERDVFVIAVDGSREAAVVSHPANDVVLGWFPDGRDLLIASDRTGTNSLWSVRVDGGRSQGEPKFLKGDIGRVVRSGFTRAGDYYYGLLTGMVDVYTTTVDPGTGKAVNEPVRLKDRYEGGKSGGVWSADGSRLAYTTESMNLHGPRSISIQTSKPGQPLVQTLRAPMSYVNGFHLAWLKDASALVLTGTDLKGRQGLFRLDVANGQLEPIVHGVLGRHPEVSRDGRTLFYERRSLSKSDSLPFAVMARDLASGSERVIYPHGVTELALSPDGESLAIIAGSPIEDSTASAKTSIRIMPSKGGTFREIWTGESRLPPTPLVWTPDGRHLLFTMKSGSNDEIWRLSIDGGPPQKVGVTLPHITSLSIHPDGRQLAIGAGISALEIWVMQNLATSQPTIR